MSLLPIKKAYELDQSCEQTRWLVQGLWIDQAVGIIGGEPKCCKSFMALNLAVSVASGVACLNRFAVSQTGTVLLFAAEDALHVVRHRLEGFCLGLGVTLENLDIQVITAPTLRLDLAQDQKRLENTVQSVRPKLLILDPFIRLHRIDENLSGEVAPILAYLRELNRKYHTAITLVHHAKKGAAKARAGQALRGSSEFHAWTDSSLFLRRDTCDQLYLSIEHRSEASQSAIPLMLVSNNNRFALEIPQALSQSKAQVSPTEKIKQVLTEAPGPVSLSNIRRTVKIRNAIVSKTVNELLQKGSVQKTNTGYQLCSN